MAMYQESLCSIEKEETAGKEAIQSYDGSI
jgi:hypothetical protein